MCRISRAVAGVPEDTGGEGAEGSPERTKEELWDGRIGMDGS